DLYDLTLATGATITINAATSARIEGLHTCIIDATVILDKDLAIKANGDFVIGANADTNNGASNLYLYASTSGHGLTSLDASATIGNVLVFNSVAGARLAAGTYSGLVKLLAVTTLDTLLQLDAGTYNFDGGVELNNTGTSGLLTFDCSANGPTINIAGDLTIDLDSTGNITIDNSGQSVDWDIQGDVIDEITGGGAFTWTKGTGTITASGTSDQDWAFDDQSIEDLTISKAAAGYLTLANVATELNAIDMAGALTITDGTITASADAKNVAGNVDWGHAGNDIMAGSATWTFDEDFDYAGIGTWDRGTATFILTGSAPNILAAAGGGKPLFNLTFGTDSDYQVTESTSVVPGLLLVKSGATIDVATGRFLLASTNSEVQIQSGATISRTGTGYFWLSTATLSQQDGEIIAECRADRSSALVGGNYSGLLKFYNSTASNYTMALTGAFTAGSLEIETTGTGNIILDCTALTAMTVAGNFTYDIDSTGDITVDNTGNSAAWVFQADVIDEVTGGGSFTWTKGSSGTISATGGNAQNWDWNDAALDGYVHNKSAGVFVLADTTQTLTNKTLTTPTLTIPVIGDFTSATH
ncbi:hypothetical protein LCGC14_2281010, partial [marine sediment metagenome]